MCRLDEYHHHKGIAHDSRSMKSHFNILSLLCELQFKNGIGGHSRLYRNNNRDIVLNFEYVSILLLETLCFIEVLCLAKGNSATRTMLLKTIWWPLHTIFPSQLTLIILPYTIHRATICISARIDLIFFYSLVA